MCIHPIGRLDSFNFLVDRKSLTRKLRPVPSVKMPELKHVKVNNLDPPSNIEAYIWFALHYHHMWCSTWLCTWLRFLSSNLCVNCGYLAVKGWVRVVLFPLSVPRWWWLSASSVVFSIPRQAGGLFLHSMYHRVAIKPKILHSNKSLAHFSSHLHNCSVVSSVVLGYGYQSRVMVTPLFDCIIGNGQ